MMPMTFESIQIDIVISLNIFYKGLIMQVYQCGELIRATYAQIGSGDQGYIPAAITCAIKTFNDIAEDTNLPLEVRERAAFAAANLLISDHEDK